MTEWANRQRDSDAEWRLEREQAEQVPCTEPGCEAPPGRSCQNLDNGDTLARLPAHWRRIRAARIFRERPQAQERSDDR